jgi:hypothetical protein
MNTLAYSTGTESTEKNKQQVTWNSKFRAKKNELIFFDSNIMDNYNKGKKTSFDELRT